MRISDWSSDVCSSDLLRTAQHLDALEVEDRGQRIVGTEAERAHLDRRVVDIDPGRPCARARRNAADADLVLTGIELHARREARQILERFDPDRKSTRLNSSH